MRIFGISSLAAFLFLLPTTGAIGADQGSLDQGQERVLDGHGFLPSLYVSDPWVTTSFQNHTGGGMAMDLQTPFHDLDGNELFVLKGDLFYATLGLNYQYGLGKTWAVGGSFAVKLRSGINTQTLVVEGANVDRSMNLWVKRRLVRTASSQFTLGLDWDYTKAFVITPQEFARSILDGEGLDTASLLHSVKGWTARLTMDYAHAFSPTYALRANGRIGFYEVPFTSGVAKPTHRLGLLMEMDFKHKYRIPLGLTLGHTLGFPDEDPEAGLSGTLLGFWYTGREAFVVGVETGFMTSPVIETGEKIDSLYGVFTLRYYF